MTEYHSPEDFRKISDLYCTLADELREVYKLRQEIRKLKNHPINDYVSYIHYVCLLFGEAKGTQKILLKDIFEFVQDFKRTRNENLKPLIKSISMIADKIADYDKVN